ncbi:hypothetical protein RHSIM_Rhsim12G0010400 [Rhododendron simsii]|uniref:Uncharacterized protein n=1 Tax=Rhododendron simsii TaxID=118357 RepID=A0A834L923_RHOSS|nr:hypothetical protein RHSIM_Rhsim12G0010400 [Rhododendron simsii]
MQDLFHGISELNLTLYVLGCVRLSVEGRNGSLLSVHSFSPGKVPVLPVRLEEIDAVYVLSDMRKDCRLHDWLPGYMVPEMEAGCMHCMVANLTVLCKLREKEDHQILWNNCVWLTWAAIYLCERKTGQLHCQVRSAGKSGKIIQAMAAGVPSFCIVPDSDPRKPKRIRYDSELVLREPEIHFSEKNKEAEEHIKGFRGSGKVKQWYETLPQRAKELVDGLGFWSAIANSVFHTEHKGPDDGGRGEMDQG